VGLDHSKATSVTSFEGLLLFCVNDQKQCELAFLSCKDHDLDLRVRVVLPNGSELPLQHKLDLRKDLLMEVVNPDHSGIDFFEDGEFDRKKGKGDAEDARWIIDLEGAEFHDKALEFIPNPVSSVEAKLAPKLLITDGTIYTFGLPEEQLARKRIDTVAGPVFLGKAADIIGLNIACLDGGNSGVILSNKDVPESRLKLPKVDGIRYRIEFKNKCEIQAAQPGSTDFSLYYDVLKDPTNADLKFDLSAALPKDDPKVVGTNPFPDAPLFAPDGAPQRCGGGRISLTTHIG